MDKKDNKPELEDLEKKNLKEFSQPKEENDPVNLFDDAPPAIKKSLMMALKQTSIGPAPNPLFEKIDESHITKFLELMGNDDKNQYKLKSSNRVYQLIYTILLLGTFIFLIVFLIKGNKDLLVEIFKLFGAFIAGIGSGFGFKVYLDKEKN